MALRISEDSIVSAEICSRWKHRVSVRISFVDGSTVCADLRGDPYRDLAGRKLTLRHPSPDPAGRRPARLSLTQTGVAGDITASRKVCVPAVPESEPP